MPRGWVMRQFITPTLIVLLAATLCLLEYSEGVSHRVQFVLAVGIIVCAVAVFIRRARKINFSDELIGMLRRIQSGERMRSFYFQSAISSEDRAVALAFAEAMKSVHRRFHGVLQERMGEEAVLASMAEGVLVIDMDEQIMRINAAAAQLLGTTAEHALGRSIQETIRNVELQKFVRSLLHGDNPGERDIELRSREERYLQMTGRELHDLDGKQIGGIIVLSDVTRLRGLERTRRDFIANVSHELKTPITSIRGFAETLEDGALDNPEDARRFLGIITRQAERLNQIFDDMLVLSQLEQEQRTDLREEELEAIVKLAAQGCEVSAGARQVTITLECMADLKVEVNPALLEQALVNLIDNAVKYSGVGAKVILKTGVTPAHQPYVAVQDNGCGIEAQHLSRIFERFYRVDKGRSRNEGGTGLGLAIVKHIAQVHGGYATVQSAPGSGSTFTIFLGIPAEMRQKANS